jgi:DNA-binding transcriptional regulator YiaG
VCFEGAARALRGRGSEVNPVAKASSLARLARKKTGLTQREFAARIGASRSAVATWEAGLREPSSLTVSLLCLIAWIGPRALTRLNACHGSMGNGRRR